jgi:hypothetical protein
MLTNHYFALLPASIEFVRQGGVQYVQFPFLGSFYLYATPGERESIVMRPAVSVKPPCGLGVRDSRGMDHVSCHWGVRNRDHCSAALPSMMGSELVRLFATAERA